MADETGKISMLALLAYHGLKYWQIQAEYKLRDRLLCFRKAKCVEERRRRRKKIAGVMLMSVLILCHCNFQLFVKTILNAVDTRLKVVKTTG